MSWTSLDVIVRRHRRTAVAMRNNGDGRAYADGEDPHVYSEQLQTKKRLVQCTTMRNGEVLLDARSDGDLAKEKISFSFSKSCRSLP